MKILIITFFLLILGLLDLINPVRNVFQKFSTPVQFGLRRGAISLKDSLQLFYNLNQIRKENLDLLRENQELKSIVVDLKKAEEENFVLKEQLELKGKERFDKELILASVMGNSKDLTGTSLVIDKGNRQGIKIGDNAILGNYLIGRIKEVSGERSVLELTTSSQVSMTVVNNELNSHAEGLARGELGTSIRVSKLLPGDQVAEGDVFITSGKDGNFLPGFIVGQVTEINFGASDPLKSALLSSMVDFSRLEKAFVILGQ